MANGQIVYIYDCLPDPVEAHLAFLVRMARRDFPQIAIQKISIAEAEPTVQMKRKG